MEEAGFTGEEMTAQSAVRPQSCQPAKCSGSSSASFISALTQQAKNKKIQDGRHVAPSNAGFPKTGKSGDFHLNSLFGLAKKKDLKRH